MRRKLLFTALVFLVFLVAVEGVARLYEHTLTTASPADGDPGWQAEFFGSVFDWHEPDPDLHWRFKANLHNPLITTNEYHYLGDTVTNPKAGNVFRVLLLGDSSPVGLGLTSHRQTFGEGLKYFLGVALAGEREVELINAAVSGYSSEQVVRYLAQDGWLYEPDLVIVYCGNNDASVSGPVSDRELYSAQRLGGIRRLVSNLAVYRLLRGALTGHGRRGAADESSLVARVSPDEFGENIVYIARQCRERQCPLMILKPPVPYLWPAGLQFKVFTHVTGESGRAILPDAMAQLLGRDIKYCLSRELFADLYGQGDVFTKGLYASAYRDSLSPESAVDHYRAALGSSPDHPVLLNNLPTWCFLS